MIISSSRPLGPMQTLRQGLAALLLVFAGAAYGQTSSDYAVVDGVTIYYAVLPADAARLSPGFR